MTVSKFLSFILLSLSLWLPAQATQTTSTNTRSRPAAPSRPPATEDQLARHLKAAETYQLAGNFARAADENRAIVTIALRRLGIINIREGQFPQAIQLLGEALAAGDDTEVRTNLAIAHMRLMEIDNAISQAHAALKLDQRNARAHHVLGKLLYMKGDHAQAQPELERALVLESDLDAAYTLGMAYLRLKKIDRAKLLFKEMQAALNNSASAHLLFGRAYHETGYPLEAEREFKQALAIDPKAPRAHFYLGYVILQHGGSERLTQASREFEQELQQRPQDFYSHFFLGVLATTVENNHQKAIRHLLEATRLKPNLGEPYLYLGQSQVELGDAAAEKSLRRAIELTADVSHNNYQIKKAHFLLGRLLIKAGRRAEGEKELASARELQGRSLESSRQEISEILGSVSVVGASNGDTAPSQAATTSQRSQGEPRSVDSRGEDVLLIEESALESQEAIRYRKMKGELTKVLAQAYHNLGVIAAQQGQLTTSAEQFAAASRWEPELAGLDRNWGIVSFRAAQYDQAVPLLARQLKTHPDDALARRMLGVSYYLTNNFQQAVATLKPLESTITSDPEMAYAYGVSLVHLADHQTAGTIFTRLARQYPQTAQARLYAAQGLAMIGDYEGALNEYRRVAELDPKMLQAHYHAGQSLIRLNRLEEAEKEFRQELLLNPADEVAKYHLAYVLLERKQQIREALALLREAIVSRPRYADARYQLGKALLEQGDVKEAIEHLEIAAEVDPSKDYIHYQLNLAYRRASRIADADRELQLYKDLKASNRSRERPGQMGAQPNAP